MLENEQQCGCPQKKKQEDERKKGRSERRREAIGDRPERVGWLEADCERPARGRSAPPVVGAFTKRQLLEHELDSIKLATRCEGRTPERTLSRVLQQLRDMGQVRFTERGKYEYLVGLGDGADEDDDGEKDELKT